MKLFIKRTTLPDSTGFIVFDEQGREKYNVNLFRKKTSTSLLITDTDNNTVTKIRRLPVWGSDTFVFKTSKKRVTFATVISSNHLHCRYYGKNWHIQGEALLKNYSVLDVDNSLVFIQKKGSNYIELEICESSDELYCVATSVCIDLINVVDNYTAQTV